jgi:hypothetical protein
MNEHGVSKTVKDVLAEALSRWADHSAVTTDSPPEGVFEVVDTLINNLDSAGFVIEMKAPVSDDVKAIDIGNQALKVNRAEAAVKAWLIEQGKNGNVVLAHQAPGWSDYQREYDRFKSAVRQAETETA